MKKRSFNIIDLGILLLVALLVCGTYYKFRVSDKTSTNAQNSQIKYVVTIPNARNYTLQALKIGDTLFDKDSGNAIGTISDISTEESKSMVLMPDGTAPWFPVENRYTINLTIEAQGSISQNTYMVNKTYSINIGSTRNFCTKYVEWQSQISAIL